MRRASFTSFSLPFFFGRFEQILPRFFQDSSKILTDSSRFLQILTDSYRFPAIPSTFLAQDPSHFDGKWIGILRILRMPPTILPVDVSAPPPSRNRRVMPPAGFFWDSPYRFISRMHPGPIRILQGDSSGILGDSPRWPVDLWLHSREKEKEKEEETDVIWDAGAVENGRHRLRRRRR